MRIAIVGLGGVGGYFGGRIALAHAAAGVHDVLFLCRGKHLAQIRNHGLRVMAVDGEFTAVPTLATDNPAELGLLDLVLFCVKGGDLEMAAATMTGSIHDETVGIPLGNGVDNAEILRSVLPGRQVLNGCVYISSHVVEPGVVQQTGGSCQLLFGPEAGDAEDYRHVEALLKGAGIKAELVDDIAVGVWSKFIFVSPVAGVTSMLGKTFGAVLEEGESRRMLEGMMGEIEGIGRGRGIALPEDIVARSLEKAAGFPYETKSSMQVDVERGRRGELETFIGYVVRSGRELGVETPINERVYDALAARVE